MNYDTKSIVHDKKEMARWGILLCIFPILAQAAVDSSQFYFLDDFEHTKSGSSPDYWIEDHQSDNWRVVKPSAINSNVYSVANTKNLSYSWLHVFERDIDVSARFWIADSRRDSALLGFSARLNSKEAMISVRYDIRKKCWYIIERQGLDFAEKILAQSGVIEIPQHIWHNVRIVARNNTLQFYLNNMKTPLLKTDSLSHLSPGRVALCARQANVYFDDIEIELLSRQGRVNKGVLEYNLNNEDGKFREGASIIEKKNGDLVLLHRAEEYLSSDSGNSFKGPFPITWPYNYDAHHSVIRLKSGRILKMVAEYNVSGKHPFDAPLRYRAKISSDEGITWTDGGTTWGDFVPDALTMNDKLSQMPDGRIFFVITRRTHVDQPARGHKSVVYFSDDDGGTWQGSNNDTKSITKLDHFCESKVIYTIDGKLRLYTPWSEAPSIHYAESDDNGITWKGDHPSDSLKNSRSSFALIEDSYAKKPTFYMIWVYDDLYASLINYLPRDRLALARSYDGKNWEYLMDVDRWISPNVKKGNRSIVQILDPSLTATKDYLFITIGRSEKEGKQGHNEQRLRVYRLTKTDLNPYDYWPSVH
ncbi:sialidase family protein [Niabella ginsengisoli]|uniref:Exo-alpha-sialidase n=1 Tax=Niabella ginsengisoli TaxID=522298 RepID=A0ABS9SJ74_9BACT|nr:sialidase family protein [Niabella ginsengisoli]MCH5598413.1 exo-alpha-sialidase [Niabella ginsengisoli]